MNKKNTGRLWWKKKRWWGVSVLALLLVCFETIPRFPFGPFTLYGNLAPEERAAKLPFVVLSDESTHPFLHGGRPLRRAWLTAIEKWPSARSCLVSSERRKSEPDLRLINWDALRNTYDANVCLWRILSSLQKPELAVDWIEFHGMRTAGLQEIRTPVWPDKYNTYPPSVMKDRDRRQVKIKVLQGWRDITNVRTHFPSRGVSSLVANLTVYGESFHVEWTLHGELMEVRWAHNVL